MVVYPAAIVLFGVAWVWSPVLARLAKTLIGVGFLTTAELYFFATTSEGIPAGDATIIYLFGGLITLGGALLIVGANLSSRFSKTLELTGTLLLVGLFAIPSSFVFLLPWAAVVLGALLHRRPQTVRTLTS